MNEPNTQIVIATIEKSNSGTFKKFNFIQQANENENLKPKRLMVLQEIIISEQDYVKDLGLIIQVFFENKFII